MIGYQRFPRVTRISIKPCPNRLHHWHIIGIIIHRYIIGITDIHIIAIRSISQKCIRGISQVYHRYQKFLQVMSISDIHIIGIRSISQKWIRGISQAYHRYQKYIIEMYQRYFIGYHRYQRHQKFPQVMSISIKFKLCQNHLYHPEKHQVSVHRSQRYQISGIRVIKICIGELLCAQGCSFSSWSRNPPISGGWGVLPTKVGKIQLLVLDKYILQLKANTFFNLKQILYAI